MGVDIDIDFDAFRGLAVQCEHPERLPQQLEPAAADDQHITEFALDPFNRSRRGTGEADSFMAVTLQFSGETVGELHDHAFVLAAEMHDDQMRVRRVCEQLAEFEVEFGKAVEVLLGGVLDGFVFRVVSLDDHFAPDVAATGAK